MDYTHLKELLQAHSVTREYPDEVDKILEDIAKSGIVRFSWELLKPLLRARLQQILDSGFEGQECKDDEGLCDRLLDKLDTFESPPFTIQRLCELITEPRRHYKRIGAYMRAMERNLLVVTTQKPDLTWMKSPRLTQLLEEPVKESESESSPLGKELHSNGDAHQYSDDVSPDSPSDSRHPISSALDAIPLSISNGQSSMEFEAARLSRKRKSCDRDDSEDNSLSDRGAKEPQTVLQEADSTTTVGADKEETAMIVDTPSPLLSDSNNSSDIEGEEKPAKKHRSSSPEAIVPTVEPRTDGFVTSVLDESEQVQNMSTGQSEPLLEN